MQALVAKYGHKTVETGPLKGTRYDQVSNDRLKKAARRYTGDQAFQKYARSYALLQELEGDEAPQPCAPLALKVKVAEENSNLNEWWSWCKSVLFERCRKVFQTRTGWLALCLIFLLLLAKPAVTTTFAKLVASSVRLALRRCIAFWSLIMESLMDEVIYQLEYTVREALPLASDIPEAVRPSNSLVSHFFSAAMGGFAAFLGFRRYQVQP